MTKQNNALRLAEQYDYGDPAAHSNTWKVAVCTELRRQHARIAELEAQLESIGAGGVSGPLMGCASIAASAGSEPVAHLWQHSETGRTRVVMPDAVVDASASWLLVGPLYLHPSPPEGMLGGRQDIATAPKDGTRFVAVGQNYGLDSEAQHTCMAQWFRGCWIEVSEWNEISELKYLTHWMPLPPLPGSAARATADSVTAPTGEINKLSKHKETE